MSKTEIEELFNPLTFGGPLVVTSKDGFAVPVTDSRDVLIGLRMLAVKFNGRIYHFPFHAIAHVSESGEMLG